MLWKQTFRFSAFGLFLLYITATALVTLSLSPVYHLYALVIVRMPDQCQCQIWKLIIINKYLHHRKAYLSNIHLTTTKYVNTVYSFDVSHTLIDKKWNQKHILHNIHFKYPWTKLWAIYRTRETLQLCRIIQSKKCLQYFVFELLFICIICILSQINPG